MDRLGDVAFGGIALGGVTLAGLAIGGFSVAEHANDARAEKFFSAGAAGAARTLLDYSEWFLVLAVLPVLVGWRRRD